MDERKYCIYIMKSPSGKYYVGQTCDVASRQYIYKNPKYARRQPKIGNAIAKYGFDNMNFTVIKEGLTKKEANEQEMNYIKVYDSKDNGYNSTDGGEGSVGYIASPETRQKLVDAARKRKDKGWVSPNKGKSHSPETIAKMIATKAITMNAEGYVHPHTGKKFSEERKQKISEKLKKKTVSEETRKKIAEKLRGRKQTQEHIEKMKAALHSARNAPGYVDKNKGKKQTPEQVEKMKAGLKASCEKKGISHPMEGKSHNEETRNKMKEAWARRKADPNYVHSSTGRKFSEESIAKMKATYFATVNAPGYADPRKKCENQEKDTCSNVNLNDNSEEHEI